MTLVQAVISGIIQGITEFLPISSSGHLVILHHLFGLKENQVIFDIFLHLGTLIAVIFVFWADLKEIFSKKNKLSVYILLGTIATGCVVLLFGRRIEDAFTNVKLVGWMLILTGIWLILSNFIRITSGTMSNFKAVIIGLAQGLAALPGVSRSGATISTGLFLGIDGPTSAKFSFLLSIPAIIGAALLKLKQGSFIQVNVNYFAGFIISCVVGILSLKLLLNILKKQRFYLFGFYCILLGMVALLFK